jgi:hypothetical protein
MLLMHNITWTGKLLVGERSL